MELPQNASLILFDGVCNLCDKWVHHIIRNDPEKKFYFASLTSELGQRICSENGVLGNETILLVTQDQVFQKSRAAFRILKELKTPISLLKWLSVFPTFLTDKIYELIAKNRYKVHGRKDACMIPETDIRDRFIDL